MANIQIDNFCILWTKDNRYYQPFSFFRLIWAQDLHRPVCKSWYYQNAEEYMLVPTKNTWDLAQTPQTFNVFLLFLCMYRKYLIWHVMIAMYISFSVIDQSLDLDWKIWLFVAFQGLGLKMKGVGSTLRNVALKHPFLPKLIFHFTEKLQKGEFSKDFFVVLLNTYYPF